MELKLRETYKGLEAKNYDKLKEENIFSMELNFNKDNKKESILTNIPENPSRVWLLFGKRKDDSSWLCLQVGQSKNEVKKEIENLIILILENEEDFSFSGSFSNSAFYENVCPKVERKEYIMLLYKMIGKKFYDFKVCFLNVDTYLDINKDRNVGKDTKKIIDICKNQYAEAKIAYETLAIYWRLFPSGIDGQTISYFNSKRALTLEQFTDLVKEKYLELGPAKSDKDALKYFFCDEAQNHIKAEYKSSLNDFNNGELGLEGFRIGEVGKVAYCLFMMYE